LTQKLAPQNSNLEALPADEGEWQTVGVKSVPAVSEAVAEQPTPALNGFSKKQPLPVPVRAYKEYSAVVVSVCTFQPNPSGWSKTGQECTHSTRI
jgi:hypothetical protein